MAWSVIRQHWDGSMAWVLIYYDPRKSNIYIKEDMSLYSFVSSKVARLNKNWTKKVEENLSFLKTSALAIVSMPLDEICPDVLNTPSIDESTDIIWASLAYGAFMVNRDAGSGKLNAFRQIAFEKFTSCERLMREIEVEVCESPTERDTIVRMTRKGIAFEHAFAMGIANWAIRKLCRRKNVDFSDENYKNGVTFLANSILRNAGAFPR